jgi:hypothetical protein
VGEGFGSAAAARRSRYVRAIWAACLLLAALNHARILLIHGLWWDYDGAGWASTAYWSSLTILDPVAAALLFIRPRIGVVMSALLVVTNVAHNLAITARFAPDGEFLARTVSGPQIPMQVGFMIVVLATFRIAWGHTGGGRGVLR